jgi:hypothetical protein
MNVLNLANRMIIIASNDRKLLHEYPVWLITLGFVSLIVSMYGWFDILSSSTPISRGKAAVLSVLYSGSTTVALVMTVLVLFSFLHVLHYERKQSQS